MALSLKAELEIWAAALKAYDEQDFLKSLELFSRIADSSKILTNMALIYATIGEHEIAVEHFDSATSLDKFLAIAHFQCGVSNFLLGRYNAAYANFEDAFLYLRGNPAINYEQLGLKFKLFAAEVLFNRGLSQIYLGYNQEGMSDLKEARNVKVTEEHDVIDEAIRDRGERYTVFSIPVGILYRPSENKLKNSKAKDYLGKAKLVAASDVNDAYTEFSGVTKLKQQSDAQADASPNPSSNSDRKGTGSPALNRSATVPTQRTTSLEPTPPLERSKTTNDIPQTQDRERGHPPALRYVTLPTLQFPLPPTSTPRSSPTSKSSRTDDSGSAAQLQSQQTQASSPLSASQPFQQPPRPPARPAQPAQPVLPPPHLLASRRSQSVSHVSPARTKANMDGGRTAGTGLVRSNTSTGVMKGGNSGLIKQGIGVGMVGGTDRNDVLRSPLQDQPQPTPASARFAEFYDDYVGAYTDDPSSLAYAGVGSGRGSSRSPPSLSRSATVRSQPSGLPGLPVNGFMGGWDYAYRNGISDGRTVVADVPQDICTIRVKLYYQGEVRGMTLPASTLLSAFTARVATKFGVAIDTLRLKFVDEDGVKISLRDEEDWGLAMETATGGRSGKTGVEGRLEVWCEEI
ncbi:hypothetical protein SCLCIDRAFT_1213681 [Scleroderma citrinum Foug A]|uniref:PB1 domain-containing protein n=1 Tax=Scleroderma citrinum Foug A TaxID=1036808 RepID=A0A0C3DTD8_9AGAM|nr:hypothetical protein SCLCIDRAFT_1213681 [Scleroderma citrinum Foug A]